jgi:transposase
MMAILKGVCRMPKSLSLDLRQRAVDAYDNGEGTFETVAERFKVSKSSLWRFSRQQRLEGHLVPKQRGGGKKPCVRGEHEDLFKRLVKANQDWTLAELRDGFEKETGIRMGITATSMTCRRLNLRRKKKSPYAQERERDDVQKKDTLMSSR